MFGFSYHLVFGFSVVYPAVTLALALGNKDGEKLPFEKDDEACCTQREGPKDDLKGEGAVPRGAAVPQLPTPL